MKTRFTPSINGVTEPKTFWRKRSKIDPKAWEYTQGVGNAHILPISLDDIPDEAIVHSGYWSKTSCTVLWCCGGRHPNWITVKSFPAKVLKQRTVRTIPLSYESYPKNT